MAWPAGCCYTAHLPSNHDALSFAAGLGAASVGSAPSTTNAACSAALKRPFMSFHWISWTGERMRCMT